MPETTSDQNEQDVHLHTLRDNTPGWYTDSLAKHKTQLALQPLNIPDWFKHASGPSRDALKAIHVRSRRSLNQLDQLLIGLNSAADFAEPLLVEAIKKTFGLQLDVRRVFYARKMEQKECDRVPYEASQSSKSARTSRFYFYKGVSLLEAALSNFNEDETRVPVCQDCHLITRYDFHRPLLPHSGDLRSMPAGIKAHEFARMCRTLDLGARYYEHVRATLNTQITSTIAGVASGKLYSSMITAHRNQLELAAQVAVMKRDIQNDGHALIRDILVNQSGRQLDGEDIKFSRFSLCALTLENILIIGPVAVKPHLRNASTQPRRCLVYIPGDPECVLKEYSNLGWFADELTTRLCKAEYRAFFSQFVPLSEQEVFFTKLKTLLDPTGKFTQFQDFDPARKSRIRSPADFGYGLSLKDVWLDSALQSIRVIMANSRAAAVSTADMDNRVASARLSLWGNRLLDILNVAGLVVPGLGEVMLAVGALQMAYELFEGIESWSGGHAQEAWAHFSTVLLSVAGLAIPKALLLAKESAFVKRLVRVEFADARVRLLDSDLGAFRHSITLPAELKPDARGLYVHDGESYLPVEGGHYKVAGTHNDTRLIHPDDASQYSPRIRHNGGGAWVHEFEQPLTWDRRTLLRRIGHTVDALSDTDLERLRVMSGVTDEELRAIYIDQQLPPPLFMEALGHFEANARYQTLLENLRSTEPEALMRVDGYQQLKLITREGVWPATKTVAVIDDSGNVVWQSADANTQKPVIRLDEGDVHAGRILPSLLAQMDLVEARQLLDEGIVRDTVTLDLMFGPTEVELPEHLQRPLQRRALDVPSDAKRAANYQRRLLQLATDHRIEIIEHNIASSNLSGDSNVQLVQRSFPGLPKRVIEEILAHANSAELEQMAQHSRLPLRLAEEARCYLPRVRIMRANVAINFDTRLTMDSARLALHKLAAIPGKLDGTGIELRAGSSTGTVLDRVGSADAPRHFKLVRASMEHWEVLDASGSTLYSRADKDAFYSALWYTTGGQFTDWEALNIATEDLKSELVRQPLSESVARRALGVQPINPAYKSPLRLADGRFGYPLSPVGGAAKRPFSCSLAAAKVYPSKTLEEVEAFLDLEGRSDADLLARLTALGHEFEQLDTVLATWSEEAGSAYARARRRVAHSIKYAWQRASAPSFAADGTPIGCSLDLSEESIGQLPMITANMDHVGSLNLSRMSLTDDSMAFLRCFGRLRWLKLHGNYLTQLPDFANDGMWLTKLDVSTNDIELTAEANARLEGMHRLKILNLSGNLRLGWTANLSGMRSLNRLDLSDTATTTFPSGAEHLTQLAWIDLHSNQISTLPEYAYEHPQRINLHDNPLSAQTLQRLGLQAPVVQPGWEHVTAAEGREAWLRDLEQTERSRCETIWDSLTANPQSSTLLTVVADTTRSAEYLTAATRPQLRARVWEMLKAVSESESIRNGLFEIADDRVTCGDGSTLEFMNLERELFVLNVTDLADGPDLENQLLSASKKLFRLKLVDEIAQREVISRGAAFTEQSEVILAYRIGLADKLALPVKSREMLFSQVANVSQAAINDAYAQILTAEAVSSDQETFLVQQAFWDRYLRTHYGAEFKALIAGEIERIDEKTDALYELSRSQEAPGAQVDQATRDAWQTTRDQAVERVASALGMSREQILVDGSMQSDFYVKQMDALSTARREQENLGLALLTRKILNNHAAEQGTQL
ncbi:NEL-type E3 ubiquitin ligase domain-containing protein [Pseudomonas sp. S1_E04]